MNILQLLFDVDRKHTLFKTNINAQQCQYNSRVPSHVWHAHHMHIQKHIKIKNKNCDIRQKPQTK